MLGMEGIEDMEPPRALVRVKEPMVGDLGVGSVTKEDLRACIPPEVPEEEEAPVAPKVLARVFICVGDSVRGEPGLESKRMFLGIDINSSWAMMMRQSRGNSRSISGKGPSQAVPGKRDAAGKGYGCPSGW